MGTRLIVLFFVVMAALIGETASGQGSSSKTGQLDGKPEGVQELKTISANSMNACNRCHGENTNEGLATRFARQLYDTSGHNLGMRTQTATGSAEAFAFDEGTGAYTARADMTLPGLGTIACNGCHNEKSFKEILGLKKQNYNNATALSMVTNPIKIECFTCHEPHTNNDYRIVKHGMDPVELGDGITTFTGGKGNLCARCHRQVNGPSAIAALDSPSDRPLFTWGHRPQAAEMLLGAGYIPFTENYNGMGAALSYKDEKDYPHSMVVDSCVGCHMLKDSATGPLAGHNFYLTDYRSDVTTGCKTCHAAAFKSANPFGGVGFKQASITIKLADYDGDGAANQLLAEVEGMRNTLIRYFSSDHGFQVSAPMPGPLTPIRNLIDPGQPCSKFNFHGDWIFNDGNSFHWTPAQAKSMWDFKMVVEDRSQGIHNPRFAARLLYDAIKNLNINDTAGLPLGNARP
jgi:hypothetical protein